MVDHGTNSEHEIVTIERQEKRRHRRLRCDGAAEVIVLRSGKLYRGMIADISNTGCYFETRAILNLALYDELDLVFRINNRRFAVFARCMNERPGKGLGLEFIFQDAAKREMMELLVHKLAERKAKR